MNNLQFVTSMKRGMFPLASLNDGLIQFHRHPVRLHTKLSDERRQSQTFRKFLLFTVDVQYQGHRQIVCHAWLRLDGMHIHSVAEFNILVAYQRD